MGSRKNFTSVVSWFVINSRDARLFKMFCFFHDFTYEAAVAKKRIFWKKYCRASLVEGGITAFHLEARCCLIIIRFHMKPKAQGF
jgi:hypothetical protein